MDFLQRPILLAVICALSIIPQRLHAQEDSYRLQFQPDNMKILDLEPTVRRYFETRGRSRTSWRPSNEIRMPPMALLIKLAKINLGVNRKQAEDILGKEWIVMTSDKCSVDYMSRAFPGLSVRIAYAATEKIRWDERRFHIGSGPGSPVLDCPAVVPTWFPAHLLPESRNTVPKFSTHRPLHPQRIPSRWSNVRL
jgi:hypothetical protein